MGNEKALSRYLDEQQKREEAFDNMFKDFDDELFNLDVLITIAKKFSSNYEGYDFSEEMKDTIRDLI